jgi:tetratricopeptide (TPR) repeat protein
MKAAPRFIILIVVVLGLVGIIAFPRRTEQIAMLAEEGRHREAIAILERRLSDQPRAPEIVAGLARSYAAVGETTRAIDLYEAYLTLRSDDLLARQKQADLLIGDGQVDRYLESMGRLVEASPTQTQIGHLVALLRLYGRTSDELAALQTYAARDLLNSEQLRRLGALLAARGNWREARRWLAVDETRSPPDDSTGRLLLFEALLQDNEAGQAYRYAEKWIAAWRSPFLSGRLILRMAGNGFVDEAVRLALTTQNLMPDTAFEMVGLFIHRGRVDLARATLLQWSGRTASPTKEQLHGLVSASARLDDAGLVIGKFMQLRRDRADPAVLAEMADEITMAFGVPVLGAIRPFLSTDVLSARPIFAARLSLAEGNHELARWYLDGCRPDQMTPAERAIWLTLVQRVDAADGGFRRLLALWNSGRLPPDLAPLLARQAAEMGHVATHDMIWRAAAH